MGDLKFLIVFNILPKCCRLGTCWWLHSISQLFKNSFLRIAQRHVWKVKALNRKLIYEQVIKVQFNVAPLHCSWKTASNQLSTNAYTHQGCQIFLLQHTKTGKTIPNYHKLYHMAINYIKLMSNRPNGQSIYQYFPFQNSPKFTQIGILGLKTYYLATLTLSMLLTAYWHLGMYICMYVCILEIICSA
jgi:hypothetical protein